MNERERSIVLNALEQYSKHYISSFNNYSSEDRDRYWREVSSFIQEIDALKNKLRKD